MWFSYVTDFLADSWLGSYESVVSECCLSVWLIVSYNREWWINVVR